VGEEGPLATVAQSVARGSTTSEGAPGGTAALRLGEAVELGHAWVQRLADTNGTRILFLKGPALHRQGLRAERTSSDVDLLVEPRLFEHFCASLLAAGWYERPADFITSRTSVHSRTFLRDGWPCDIDVHSHYPGFLSPAADVFEILWADRVRMTFAHKPCDVPDRLASALILALHSLRGKALEARHGRELDELLQVELDARDRDRLAELAVRTRCAATLEEVLPRMGIHLPLTEDERSTADAVRWRRRVASGSHGAYFWIDAFRRGDGRERVAVAARAVWPSREHLLLSRPDVVDTMSGRLKGRIARWGRGIRSLPQAMRAISQNR
jgi:hypothetical protein